MNQQTVRVRFAPSPTGRLHIGNVRTAVFNWLFAGSTNGIFILRIEDTDTERSSEEWKRYIFEDLKWLGLHWDEGPDAGGPYGPYSQLQRMDLYIRIAEELIRSDAAYRCWCTMEELEKEKERRKEEGLSLHYSGKCRSLTQEQIQENLNSDKPYVIRFKVPAGDVMFNDEVMGVQKIDKATIGDFVLLRNDKRPTYNFAATVDDHFMKITHVIRGNDHLYNTFRQIMIYYAMNWEPPAFLHISMILGPDHSRLSKRHGAFSLYNLIRQGYLPDAVLNFLALLGWSPGDETEILPRRKLIEIFDVSRLSRSPAIFETAKLKHINGYFLNQLSEKDFKTHWNHWSEISDDWRFLTDFSEAREWFDATVTEFRPKIQNDDDLRNLLAFFFQFEALEDRGLEGFRKITQKVDLIEFAQFLLDDMDEKNISDTEGFLSWIREMKSKTQLKGRNLFMSLRILLTGKLSGPELHQFIPLLHKGNKIFHDKITDVDVRLQMSLELLKEQQRSL